MKNFLRSIKKQIVLQLEVNVIGTSTVKNLQKNSKFRKILCSSKSNLQHLSR